MPQETPGDIGHEDVDDIGTVELCDENRRPRRASLARAWLLARGGKAASPRGRGPAALGTGTVFPPASPTGGEPPPPAGGVAGRREEERAKGGSTGGFAPPLPSTASQLVRVGNGTLEIR